jgi:ribosomal protein S18 acetylase RimI-like enzyme
MANIYVLFFFLFFDRATALIPYSSLSRTTTDTTPLAPLLLHQHHSSRSCTTTSLTLAAAELAASSEFHYSSSRELSPTQAQPSFEAAAELMTDAFFGPFAWWQTPQREFTKLDNLASLQERYSRLVMNTYNDKNINNNKKQHDMIFAFDSRVMIGFIEIGAGPLKAKDKSETIWNELTALQQSSTDDGGGGGGEALYVPQIGNLVISPKYRRRGIGLKLMESALQVATAWGSPYAFCTVEPGNAAAIELYKTKLQFEVYSTVPRDKGGYFSTTSAGSDGVGGGDNIVLVKAVL